jgi:L-ascorbate metabolism protein UlaG (beta-lactamase superfamily)
MSQFIKEELLSSKTVTVPDDHVLSVEEAKQGMAAASNPSVTWLGHASFIVRIANKTILTDPFIGRRAGPFGFGPKRFVDAPLAADELPQVDVIVVSHDHYDHLDAHAINNYKYKTSTQVVVPLGLGRFFEKRGYPSVVEHDWWDTWISEGLSITTLPAAHFSGRGLFDRNKTLWASFSFKSEHESIWFSGDTATGDVFQEIGEREGPFDLALVAIGAYEPRSIMRSIHASPEEAIEIAQNVGAKQAIGMHWGTIRLTPENAFEPPARFKRAAREQGYGVENANVLRIGETFELPHTKSTGANTT